MAAVEPGLTHWSRFDVPGMWSLIGGVSTDDAFRQAGAWQSTYEAAQSLAGRLRVYRDGLAAKWSPDGSEAAAAYLGRLDELIGSAQQLADVSVSNRQALVTLANAVDEARPKMQRVYEESQAMRQVGAQPRAGASLALRQQQLQKQATQIMESLGSAALDSWRHYATADDYQPPQPPTRDENRPLPGGISRPDSLRGSSTSVNSLQAAPRTVGNLTSGSPSESNGPSEIRDTTQLATTATSRSDLAVTASSGRPLGESPQTVSDGLAYPSITVSDQVPFSQSRFGKSAGMIPRYDPMRPSNQQISRADGIDGVGRVGNPGQDLSPRTRVVNSTGGVISGEGNGLGLPGIGSGRQQSPREYRRRREYDLDDPWFVPQGVPPVLIPGEEPRGFEPGPGVIGIDR